VFAALLLILAGGPALGDEVEPSPAGARRLVGWWHQPAMCAELGIPTAQREDLARELDQLEITYQLAQTALNAARHQQSLLLADPTVSAERLLAHNRDEVVAQSDRMQATNFQARLLVRSKLSPAQLGELTKKSPVFFAARWFRAARVPVREGQVRTAP
jgi:hypothetical protein